MHKERHVLSKQLCYLLAIYDRRGTTQAHTHLYSNQIRPLDLISPQHCTGSKKKYDKGM